ncbi:aryl-sulfate sulfotransferase [Ferrimonas lipolytica]|nr:aryl-sulfate sulfotransferase [Ferrimonas lipolytica]
MKTKLSLLATSLLLATLNANAGSVDGLKVRPTKGSPLGVVINNPYENAPLTALVTLRGHKISDVKVTIQPKDDGVKISYPVEDMRLLDEGGVPIFGLYPDYLNTVTVNFTEDGKRKSYDYKILTPDIDMGFGQDMWAKAPITDVHHVDADFKDRIYFLSWTGKDGKQAKMAHNNLHAPGAMAWEGTPGFFMIDTAGEIRWYLNPYTTHNSDDYYGTGYAMGMNVTKDGNMAWVQGQTWKHMTVMGRMISEHHLPGEFIDATHEALEGANGNFFIRVASKDYKAPNGKLVNTIRDQIIEVDPNGKLVDHWDLADILDPNREAALLSLDAGAVCLNIDVEQSGHQVTAEDLKTAPYGDIPGTGVGRNWAHVNSVDYDPKDDSIIISSRHQSAVVKIGRDKQVKWILAAREGWNDALAKKLLQPVDSKGKAISCTDAGQCEGDFDFTWTQHTAYMVPEKGTLTVFDNGDGRHLEQPAMPSMKYSRSVEYKVDPQKMTVEQVWEYGKELGSEGYAPVTSIVKYQADKDSLMSYFASPGMFGKGGGMGNMKWDEDTGVTKSILVEHRYGEKEPAVRIDIDGNQMFKTGYRAQVIRIDDMMK